MKYIRIQVLVFVISIAKSLAMTVDELEDFSNFLKETSLLDQPLKKNPADEEDDAPISDHAWEESGRFEGDLILNERQRRLIVKDVTEGLSRNGLKDSTKRWPDNEVVVYIQREHFNSDQIQAILRGMEELSQASCVKFRPYKKGDRDAVVVQGSRRGCFSQVGYQGGYQVLNLSGRHPVGRGCFRHGTVVHEFLHTLGFYHMQSSPDRDDYINVVWENIVQPARHNFRKYNLFSVSDFGVGYDYDSVLHYSRKAFSSNGGDTLVPKQDGVQIGQRIGLSDKDTAKLNKMYCDADSSNLEAADDVPHTLVTKKKKTPKNQPFEGHGIGYHKGKTVVIKLPAAETKVRLPETPSNFVFDYFSKAPQAMSPTLIAGFGVGQKVTYSYKLPAGYQITEHKFPFYRPSAFLSGINNAAGPALVQQNVKENNVLIKPTSIVGVNSSNKTKNAVEDFDEKSVKVTTTTNKDTVDSDDFTSVYKPNTDYSDFYVPVDNYKVRTNTDYYLNYSPNFKGKHAEKAKELPISNFKLTRQFIENLGETKPKNFHTDESKEREYFDHGVDIAEKTKSITKLETNARDTDPFSYVKIPASKLEEIRGIHLTNPEYTSNKYLKNKHDFSSLYYPKENVNRDLDSKNALYKLFGEPVPLPVYNYTSEENSNIHDETQNTHINRDEDNRTKQNVGFSSIYYPTDNLNKEPTSRNAPYILLGEPVPLPIYNYTSEDNSNINEYTEKIHINREGADVNKKVDVKSLYDPNDNRNGNPASRNAPYKLISYPVSLPVYDYISKENSHIRDDTQRPDNIEEEEDDKIKQREREVGSPYYSNDNVNVNRDPASRNAPYKTLGDPVPLSVYRYTSEENGNIHDDDTQNANINREADKNVNKNVDFRSLYYPNNNINGVPAAKNPPYKLLGQPLPVFNYAGNSQIDDDKLNTHTSREDGDNVNKKVNNVTKKPTFKYRNDDNSDEDHYYKDFEPLGRSRTSDYIQPTSNEENVSKSYEVTEKNVEHVSLVTDKSNADNPKSQDGETNLEKYLPVILEKYQSYDDYDITTPHRFSKYDVHEFSKTQ